MVNPLRLDPTRLTTIRRDFLRVVKEGWEVFGLRVQRFLESNPYELPSKILNTNAGLDGSEYSSDKLKRFRSWLRDKMDETLAGDALIGKYIEQGFDKGMHRSHQEGRRTGHTHHTSDAVQFRRTMKGRGATVEKVKLLASRTFAEMEDVNTRTATKMSRILADGLVQGKTNLQVAKELDAETDIGFNRAKAVARTELTRAHAEGQLIAMEQLGVNKTSATVELQTDGNPCPKCQALEGKVYSLQEASGVIPVHVNCACSWLPLKG